MSNPWDKDFGAIYVDGQTGAAPPVQVPTKTGTLMPWDPDFGAMKGGQAASGEVTQAQPVVEEENEDSRFERVFERLIQKESTGRQFDSDGKILTSNKGAQGITQVMPKTAQDPGYGVEPMQNQTKEEFIRFGRDYLTAMLKEFQGDYEKALAAYNAGPGNVKRAIAKAGEEGDWKKYLPKKSETLPYIKFILEE